jgi:hypothetical protein
MATSPPSPPGAPRNIPGLSASGTLPPYVGGDPTAASMSPYRCTLTEVARTFCTSRVRTTIFQGYLLHRRVLAGLGFVQGFQWLSGSYMETIEVIEGRAPRDIDVVTFFVPPAICPTPADLRAMAQANRDVFEPPLAKVRFHCDPYFVNLRYSPVGIVSLTRYWFGLFSHRRGGLWKGLLQVELAPSQDDADASDYVNGLSCP